MTAADGAARSLHLADGHGRGDGERTGPSDAMPFLHVVRARCWRPRGVTPTR